LAELAGESAGRQLQRLRRRLCRAKNRPGMTESFERPEGEMRMTMREGERWICSNPACRCEVLVVLSAGAGDGTNPRCSCGFAMRKRYKAPKLLLLEGKDLREKFYSKVS
jgi:hypothetical protein